MNDGGPAYPALDFIHSKDLPPEAVHRLGTTRGMSLRDWFAGQALVGALAHGPHQSLAAKRDEPLAAIAATVAYEIADAMLAERDRLTNQGDTNAK